MTPIALWTPTPSSIILELAYPSNTPFSSTLQNPFPSPPSTLAPQPIVPRVPQQHPSIHLQNYYHTMFTRCLTNNTSVTPDPPFPTNLVSYSQTTTHVLPHPHHHRQKKPTHLSHSSSSSSNNRNHIKLTTMMMVIKTITMSIRTTTILTPLHPHPPHSQHPPPYPHCLTYSISTPAV